MAKVFYQLIISGDRTINDVPARIKEEVIRLLEENGYADLANKEA